MRQLSGLEENPDNNSECSLNFSLIQVLFFEITFEFLSFLFPFMIDWHYKYNTQLYASNLNYFYIILIPVQGAGGIGWSEYLPMEFAFRYNFSFDEPCGDIILHVNNEMERFLISWWKNHHSWVDRSVERCKTDPSLIPI